MSQSTEGTALLEQRGSQHGDSNSEWMNGVAEERRRLKGKGKSIVEELDASGNQGRDLDNNHNKRNQSIRTQPRIEALRTTSRSKSKSKSRSKSNSRSKSPTKRDASTSQKNSPSTSNFPDFTTEDESRIISHLSASRRDWHGSSICHELAALYPNHSYEAYRDFLRDNLDDGLCLVDEIGKSRSRDTTERAASTSISLDSIGNDGQISNQVSNGYGNATPLKQVDEKSTILNSNLSSENGRSLRNREEWAYSNKRKIRESDEKVNRRGRTTREAAKGISYKEIPILSSSEADSDSQSEEEQEVVRKGPIKSKSISRRKSKSRVKVSRQPSNSPREESKEKDDQAIASTSKLMISNANDREWLEPEVEGLVFEMFRIRCFSPSEDLANHLSRDPGHRNQVEYLEFLKKNMNQGWNLAQRLDSLKFLLSDEEVGMGVEKRNGIQNKPNEIPNSDDKREQDTEAILKSQKADSKVAINSSAPTSSVATPSQPKSSSVATPSKPKSLILSTPLKIQSSSVAAPSKPSSSVATPKKFGGSSVNTPSKSQPRPISSYFQQVNTPPNNDKRNSTSNSASGARAKRLESQIRIQERTSGSFSPPSPRSLLFPDSYPPSASKKRKQSEEVREDLVLRTPSSADKSSSRPNKRPRQGKVIDLIAPEPELVSGPIDLTTPEPALPGNLNSNHASAFVDMTLDEDSEDEQMDLDQDHDSTLGTGPASLSVPVVQSSGEIPPTSAVQPQQKADYLLVDQEVRSSPSQEQTEVPKEAPSSRELIETVQIEADQEIQEEIVEGNEREVQEETPEDLQGPVFGEEQVEDDLKGEMEQDPRLSDDAAGEELEDAEVREEDIQEEEEARDQEAEAAESRDEENRDEEILEELETQEQRTEEEEIEEEKVQEEEMQEEEKGGEEEAEEKAIEQELSLEAEEETQDVEDKNLELEKEFEDVYREESQPEELPQEEVQEAEFEDEDQEDDVHREDEQEDNKDLEYQEQERQLQAEVLEVFPNRDEELSSQVGQSSESPPPPYHLANAGSVLSDGDLFPVSEEESMPAQGADLDDESESEGEEERRRAEQELDEEVARLRGPESPSQRNSSSKEKSRDPSPTLTSRQVPAQPASLVNGGFVPFKSVASSSSKSTSRKQFNPWDKQSASSSTSSDPIPRANMTKGSRASSSRILHSSPFNKTSRSVSSQAGRSSSIVAFSDQGREKPSYLAYKEAMNNIMNEYGLDKLQMKALANLPENKGKIKVIKAGLENKILRIKKKWGLGRVEAIEVLKEENWVWEKVELRLEVENL